MTDESHQECHQCQHPILERSRRDPARGEASGADGTGVSPRSEKAGRSPHVGVWIHEVCIQLLRQAALWQDDCQHDAESGAIWPVAPSGSRPWQTGSSAPDRRSLACGTRPGQVLQNAAAPRRNSPSRAQMFESTDNPPPSEPERLPCAFNQTTAVPEKHCDVKHPGSASARCDQRVRIAAGEGLVDVKGVEPRHRDFQSRPSVRLC